MTAMRPKRAYHRKAHPAPQPQSRDADEVIAERQPEPITRPEMRATMREEDPRARAAKRAEELLPYIADEQEAHDDFYIDTDQIPDGWSYEWKRYSTAGALDPSYEVELAQTGWEAVPANRHPELMPKNHKGETIERKGMLLMERPQVVTDKVRARDQREARRLVQENDEKLGAAPPGQFDRDTPKARPRINKSYSPVEIPAD